MTLQSGAALSMAGTGWALGRGMRWWRSLGVVVLLALLGSWLVVLGAQWLHQTQRAHERQRQVLRMAQELMLHTTGEPVLGALASLGRNEALLKALALGNRSPDEPPVQSHLHALRTRLAEGDLYVLDAAGTIVAHQGEGENVVAKMCFPVRLSSRPCKVCPMCMPHWQRAPTHASCTTPPHCLMASRLRARCSELLHSRPVSSAWMPCWRAVA